MTDLEIRDALIARDSRITGQFFYKDCRPLLCSVTRRIFGNDADVDEITNELYLYLTENDCNKLRLFRGNSTIYQWIKVVALRFCLQLKRQAMVIENTSNEHPYTDTPSPEPTMDASDIMRLLADMPNRRYATVISRLVINGEDHAETAADMGVSPDNLYNIKRRAITALTRLALNDIKHYEAQ